MHGRKWADFGTVKSESSEKERKLESLYTKLTMRDREVLKRIRPEIYQKYMRHGKQLNGEELDPNDKAVLLNTQFMTPSTEMPSLKYTHKKQSLLQSPSTMSTYTVEYKKRDVGQSDDQHD